MNMFKGHPSLQPPSFQEANCCPPLPTVVSGEIDGTNIVLTLSDDTTITIDASSFIAIPQGGTTAARPGTPVLYQQYFDTTLGYPVWWNGTNWVNATGATV